MLLKILRIFQFINYSFSYLINSFNEKKFLKSFFKGKKIKYYFDIGANNGFNISLYARYLKIEKIYAFEPSISAFNYLVKKFKNFKNIYFLNIAISNKVDSKIFYDYKINSQSTLNLVEGDQILSDLRDKYYIQTETLDNFCKSNGITNIDFVKIDAQGEDYNILHGMKNLLIKKKIDLIKIEISVNKNKSIEQDDVYKIINLMHKYEYRLISISDIKYQYDQTILFMDAYFAF